MEKRSALAILFWLQMTVLAAAGDQIPNDRLVRRIDTHTHYIPEFYRDLLRENNISPGGRNTNGSLSIPAWNVSSHLAFMDSLNISLSIVSSTLPGAVIREGFPVNQSRTLARQLNEYAYNLTKQYPEKFRFLATLTLPDVEGSVAEAIYALDKLKAAGIQLLASTFGDVLGNPLHQPLYAELNKRNAVVFVHPGQSPCSDDVEFSSSRSRLTPAIVEFLLDTTRAAANLVVENVTNQYPNVKFILAHSGGFLPFSVFRTVGGIVPLTNWTESFVLSQLESFYVDTAVSGSKWALPSTLALLDASHLTYGSDFPFAAYPAVVANILTRSNTSSRICPRTSSTRSDLKRLLNCSDSLATPRLSTFSGQFGIIIYCLISDQKASRESGKRYRLIQESDGFASYALLFGGQEPAGCFVCSFLTSRQICRLRSKVSAALLFFRVFSLVLPLS